MSYFGGKQKAALKGRHKPKDNFSLELDDGMIVDFNDVKSINGIDETGRVYVGKDSK